MVGRKKEIRHGATWHSHIRGGYIAMQSTTTSDVVV